MPRLFPKQGEPVKRSAPGDLVYALVDVSKGSRWVSKGTPLRRDEPMVLERPDLFEVRYPLSEEVNDGEG